MRAEKRGGVDSVTQTLRLSPGQYKTEFGVDGFCTHVFNAVVLSLILLLLFFFRMKFSLFLTK